MDREVETGGIRNLAPVKFNWMSEEFERPGITPKKLLGFPSQSFGSIWTENHPRYGIVKLIIGRALDQEFTAIK